MAVASGELQQQRFLANPPCVRLHKPKRVWWAPEGSLCQIRLFVSEDSPQQAGLLSSQDLLQAKTSSMSHSTVAGLDDGAPPGFEGPRSPWQLKKDLSKLHVIKWKCPPAFVLNPAWQVVAGEESKEIMVQNQRQLRVLEAVYPRPSSIPPSPSVAPEVHEDFSELTTPLIPLTPVEDDELTECLDSVRPTNVQNPCLPESLPVVMQAPTLLVSDLRSLGEQFRRQNPGDVNVSSPAIATKKATTSVPAAEPDVAAAASAAFTVLMKSNEEGSLIDRDLLIKILSDPSLVEKLVTQHAIGSTATAAQPPSATKPVAVAPPGNKNQLTPPVQPLPPSLPGRPDITVPIASQPAEQLYPKLNSMPSMTNLRQPSGMPVSQVRLGSPAPPVKDINYYKSLIQQHGEEKPGCPEPDTVPYRKYPNQLLGPVNSDVNQITKPKDMKPKIAKPCIYYNSPKGCWHGSNCIYLHDDGASRQIREMPEAPSAKRVKLDREITGRS